MNGSVDSEKKMTPQSESKEATIKLGFKGRISANFFKFKTYVKTHRKQTIAASIVCLILIIGSVVILLNRPAVTTIKVAENIAEQSVGSTYDYIYNPNDTTLTAETLSGDKKLELINSDAIILDYAVSPNKEKIAYVVATKNYKEKITSPNSDITKFKFNPVGFEIYELNLKTGENKKLWSRDPIKLKATEQQLYYKKEIIFPDSFVVGYYYKSVISYPENGEPFYQSVPASYTVPVSYSQVIDDVQRGYMYEDLPWDLGQELFYYTVSIVGYDKSSEKLAISKDNKITIFNSGSSQDYSIPTDTCYSSISMNNKLMDNLIYLEDQYCKDYRNSGPKMYQIKNNNLEDLLSKYDTNNNQINTKYIDNDFSLVSSYPQNYYYERGYSGNITSDIVFINLKDDSSETVKKLAEWNNFRGVTATSPTVAFTLQLTHDYTSNNKYTFSKFSPTDKTFTDLGEVELPSDINDLSYDYDSNTISFYRKYTANNESIIEYRMINLETKEDKEIKTIKVSNNSVLYYKPKLVWLNL